MSIIYYFHNHPVPGKKKNFEAWSLTPHPYDYCHTGFFEDRIYHSRNSNARFYVVTFGYGKTWSEDRAPRSIDRYMIHFVLDGKGNINGRAVERGNIFFVLPNEEHLIESDAEAPMTLAWIGLAGRELELITSVLHLPKSFDGKLNDAQLKTLEELFLDTVYKKQTGDLPFLLLSRFFYALSVADIPVSNDRYVGNNIHLDHSEQYIGQHYAEDLTVEEIADSLHISVSYLRRLYDTALGYSPQRSIVRKRIAVAKSLLQLPNALPVYEIAAAVGYSDQSAFSARFKEETGLSPREYRKRYLQGNEKKKEPGSL